MRILLVIVFMISSVSCKTRKNIMQPASQTQPSKIVLRENYKVVKIDSTSNIFIIYAKKDSLVYKIVSMKDSVAKCNTINVDGEYPFSLFSIVPKEFKGLNISPQTTPHYDAIDFHGNLVTIEKENMYDIFTAINIKGLCLL